MRHSIWHESFIYLREDIDIILQRAISWETLRDAIRFDFTPLMPLPFSLFATCRFHYAFALLIDCFRSCHCIRETLPPMVFAIISLLRFRYAFIFRALRHCCFSFFISLRWPLRLLIYAIIIFDIFDALYNIAIIDFRFSFFAFDWLFYAALCWYIFLSWYFIALLFHFAEICFHAAFSLRYYFLRRLLLLWYAFFSICFRCWCFSFSFLYFLFFWDITLIFAFRFWCFITRYAEAWCRQPLMLMLRVRHYADGMAFFAASLSPIFRFISAFFLFAFIFSPLSLFSFIIFFRFFLLHYALRRFFSLMPPLRYLRYFFAYAIFMPYFSCFLALIFFELFTTIAAYFSLSLIAAAGFFHFFLFWYIFFFEIFADYWLASPLLLPLIIIIMSFSHYWLWDIIFRYFSFIAYDAIDIYELFIFSEAITPLYMRAYFGFRQPFRFLIFSFIDIYAPLMIFFHFHFRHDLFSMLPAAFFLLSSFAAFIIFLLRFSMVLMAMPRGRFHYFIADIFFFSGVCSFLSLIVSDFRCWCRFSLFISLHIISLFRIAGCRHCAITPLMRHFRLRH